MIEENILIFEEKEIKKNKSCCVCICTRLDRIEFTQELINSILHQTRKPNRILFILSGHSYKSLERRKEKLVLSMNRIDNINKMNISFVYSSKKGVAAARNTAADFIEEDILIFSDDDDIWSSDKLELTCKEIEASSQPILVRHGFHTLIEGRLVRARKIFFEKVNFTNGLIGNYYGGGSTLAANTSIFRSIRFNEFFTFCEDWEFWIRADKAGIPIHTIRKSLVQYRFHKNRKTNSLFINYKWEIFLRSKIISKAILTILFSFIGVLRSSTVIVLNYLRLILGVSRF